jgi:hypothetical protein
VLTSGHYIEDIAIHIFIFLWYMDDFQHRSSRSQVLKLVSCCQQSMAIHKVWRADSLWWLSRFGVLYCLTPRLTDKDKRHTGNNRPFLFVLFYFEV